jgi:flagellar biosynthesis component FlhA
MTWVRPTPELEDELVDRTVQTEEGPVLTLAGEERSELLARVRACAHGSREQPPSPEAPLLMVTTPRARPAMAAALAGAVPHIPVLSTAELEVASVRLPPEVRWCQPAGG